MKKLALLLMMLISGCATKPGIKETVLIKQELAEKTQIAEQSTKALQEIKEAQTAWADFKLFAIVLDKNKKPIGSKSLEIKNISDTVPFDKGPKISITDFSTVNVEGKVIQINCKNADIKQKFDTATNLPGWALEITCDKTSYFFMINKKSS